jgi:hypothetical protein
LLRGRCWRLHLHLRICPFLTSVLSGFALRILGLSRLVRVCWELQCLLGGLTFFHYMLAFWVSRSNFLCSEVYLLVDAVAYIWKCSCFLLSVFTGYIIFHLFLSTHLHCWIRHFIYATYSWVLI